MKLVPYCSGLYCKLVRLLVIFFATGGRQRKCGVPVVIVLCLDNKNYSTVTVTVCTIT
jgi:hypothetical protein